jgi:hypothetical protein
VHGGKTGDDSSGKYHRSAQSARGAPVIEAMFHFVIASAAGHVAIHTIPFRNATGMLAQPPLACQDTLAPAAGERRALMDENGLEVWQFCGVPP